MPSSPLFVAALGARWRALPASVQRLHSGEDVEIFTGRARVVRGHGLAERLVAWLVGFPDAAEDVPLTLAVTRMHRREVWNRDFAGGRLQSVLTLSPRPFHYRERFGPFTYEQELPVEEGVLRLPVRRGWFLGVPLPRMLLPRSCSREFDEHGTFQFDIGVYAPLTGGLIVRYQGWLRPDAA